MLHLHVEEGKDNWHHVCHYQCLLMLLNVLSVQVGCWRPSTDKGQKLGKSVPHFFSQESILVVCCTSFVISSVKHPFFTDLLSGLTPWPVYDRSSFPVHEKQSLMLNVSSTHGAKLKSLAEHRVWHRPIIYTWKGLFNSNIQMQRDNNEILHTQLHKLLLNHHTKKTSRFLSSSDHIVVAMFLWNGNNS